MHGEKIIQRRKCFTLVTTEAAPANQSGEKGRTVRQGGDSIEHQLICFSEAEQHQ